MTRWWRRRSGGAVDLEPWVAQARTAGLEAGWNGADDWTPLFAERLQNELYLQESARNGELGLNPASLTEEIDRARERRVALDALRDAYRSRHLGADAGRAGMARSWSWVTAARCALVQLLIGLVLSAAGVAIWQVYAALAVIAVLLALLPVDLLSATRVLALRVAADLAHLSLWARAVRAERAARALERQLASEQRRRQRRERWVAERLSVIVGHYNIERSRARIARRVHASA